MSTFGKEDEKEQQIKSFVWPEDASGLAFLRCGSALLFHVCAFPRPFIFPLLPLSSVPFPPVLFLPPLPLRVPSLATHLSTFSCIHFTIYVSF